ncbi:MAG: site-specific DNA-methyltransferase [Bacteroidota bacterium]
MNQKREEINDFLKNKLLTQVNETLSKAGNHDGEALKRELENLEITLRNAGVDPETNAKVNELRVLYASAGSPEALTNEVFSHLTSFFRRYYNQGDFISQRRYKKDVYAIPYEGEEVKLHWANHDQYYIKTGENFKNYIFKTEGGKTVHFALREANTEQNNNKAQQGKERRFKLAEHDIFTENGNELTIWFTYEPTDKKEKQDELNKAALQAITANLPEAFKTSLLQNKGTKSNPGRTLLEKHLNDYTARNTFDYFIHKDLGGFLRRELDFYIKNEILQIDEINLDDPQSFDRQLKVIKALKTVANKIIALLAQLEDFQKRLWLKKKFVMQSDYCITLDRVPESLYPDIIANTAQIEEWKRLFAIDEIKADTVTLPYSEPLAIDFLKGNPFLVLDTKFFGREWKYKLLASIENIDEQCDGLLINSENFQALRFLLDRYKNQVKQTYIDPPYNTGKDGFPYKDGFKSSSWLSLIIDRIKFLKHILTENGVLMTSLDDREAHNFKRLLEEKLIGIDLDATLIWNTEGHTDNQLDIKINHEYVIIGGKQNCTPEIGFVVDPNTREGSNLWRGYAQNSITKNGVGNPHSVIELPVGFPIKVETLELTKTDVTESFFQEIKSLNYISRELTKQHSITYPIRLDNMSGSNYRLTSKCQVLSGWANVNKLKKFIENGFQPIIEDDGQITFFLSENGVIYYNKERAEAKNILSVLRNMGTTEKMRSELEQMNLTFKYPKPKELIEYLLKIGTVNENDIVLDFFAGSGTTAHSVINLNRNGLSLKYILVEIGEHFQSVILPRIQKVIYSKDWKDGKPVSRKGSSHCFKYLRLESYEDTLNNLQLQRSHTQQSLLANPDFGEEYLLHYMLNVESRESLLNLGLFKRPFGYTLKVTENNELQPQEVDLVETFNYLIGLVVETTQIIKGNVVIEGRNLQGDKILVIWRDVEQTGNATLNEFFKKLNINTKDSEFKRIYVNGDNNLENLRTDGEQWKVVLIEEEFHKRMFDVKDV